MLVGGRLTCYVKSDCVMTDFLNTDEILLASSFRRGLNPPHRVKSISMTTFTQQEIEFLQKHGNEVSIHYRVPSDGHFLNIQL